ncbi:hypothetical protein MNBD_ALPHA06-1424 [hydrothermal vent metagenome]|uniref:Uncharacterized protein n=1 Tax=hydrothermal vent metagenome TaxID=652676 RepID=A0A3B0RVJ1_9ZZZZ
MAFGLFAVPVLVAAQDSAAVETLLDRIAVAEDEAQAELLSEEVWARFFDSGSPSVDLMLQRGITAQAQGDLDLAGDFFADVVEFAPEFAEGWNRRAALEYARGEYAAALEDLGVAISLQPRHFGALAGLGLVLERLGSAEGAYQAYQDALAVHPFLTQAIDGAARLENQVKGRQL